MLENGIDVTTGSQTKSCCRLQPLFFTIKQNRHLTQILITIYTTPRTSLYQRLYAVFLSLNFWQSRTIAKQAKMKMTIMDEDGKLKESMDEGRNLLDQLSSLKNDKVVCLDSIKNLRNRVYEVTSILKSNHYAEIFHLEHACMVEAQIYQDYTLTGRMNMNPLAEALASLQRKSKDDRAWSWLRYQGMLYAIVQGDHELSYRRAEAERKNVAICELIPRRMDNNPIADWRIESMWLHSRANTILMEIKLNCAKPTETLIAIGREIIS
ncbi:hypothetical protein V2J09_004887 [Rumex salicifolius]